MPTYRARLSGLTAALAGTMLVVPALAGDAAAGTQTDPVIYAGGGWGDGGPALTARIMGWTGRRHVAVDPAGNVYIPDSWANTVRKVDAATGIITRFAGTGVAGATGDGGPATAARLDDPAAVALRADGTVLVADRAGARIRSIAPDGTISTLAGNGSTQLSATPVPAATAAVQPTNLYVAPDDTVYVVEPYGVRKIAGGVLSRVAGQVDRGGLAGDGGPALDALLEDPTDVVRDADGVLYVADGNRRVRRIGTDGVITTIAGKGSANSTGDPGDGGPATEAHFNWITAVWLGAEGRVFAADDTGGVRSFVPGGTIDVVAPLPCRGIVEPEATGTYLVNCGQDVRRVAADGSSTTVLAGTTTKAVGDGLAATEASLVSVGGLAADAAGSLYVAERAGDRVRKVLPNGTITTVAGSTSGATASAGDGGAATAAVLRDPTDVAVAPDGTLYVADGTEATVRKVATDGTITTVAGGDAPLAGPIALVASADGVYVAAQYSGSVFHVALDGTVSTAAGGGTLAGHAAEGAPAASLGIGPRSVARTATGDLLVLAGEYLYTLRDGAVRTAVRVGNYDRVGVDGTGRVLLQGGGTLSWLASDGGHDDVTLATDMGDERPAWAMLADGRAAYAYRRDATVRVTTPTWAARPPQVSGVRVDNVSVPPVVHWTPPAGWGDAIAVPVLRRGTVAPRGPADGYDARYHPTGPTSASLSFDLDGGTVYGETYTVGVFSYSPSLRAYSAPVSVTFQPRRPPPPATGLKLAPGVGRATVSWTNPTSGTTGVVVRMAAGTTPPATATSGTQIYAGTGTSVLRTGLAFGQSYSFSVFTTNAAGDHGSPVSGTLTGTTVALRASATTVGLRAPVTISGTLRPPGVIFPPDEAVQLLGRRRGTTTFRSLGYYAIDGTGRFTFVDRPSYSVEYQVKYPGFGPRLGSYAKVSVGVRTKVTASATRTSVPLGLGVGIRGTVAPTHARQKVTVQRYVGGVWRTVAYATLSATSGYAYAVTPAARGRYYYRVVMRAHTDHAEGVSPTVRFDVV